MSTCQKCCGTCRWHSCELEAAEKEWVCENFDSRYFSDYTEHGHTCPDWEERE